VNFVATSSAVHSAVINLTTDSRNAGTTQVQLSGLWQSNPESLPDDVVQKEPTLPQIVEAFGYNSVVTYSGQSLNTNGNRTAVGDEVISDYWERADPLAPVVVKQLAAFRDQFDARFLWIRQGQKDDFNSVFLVRSTENQTVQPKQYLSTKAARGSFVPSTTVFGFRTDQMYSVDAFNETPRTDVHLMRFFPARDENGQYVADTWLMMVDYNGFNYDFQDGIFLIKNIKPSGQLASVVGASAYKEGSRVRVDWADTSGASGYYVQRSDKSNSGFTTISAKLTASTFLDTTATAGKTWYYRVIAQDGSGNFNVPTSSSAVL
jgi:hypothetical protein